MPSCAGHCNRAGRILRGAAGILYPERCVFCDAVLEGSGRMLCGSCRQRVRFLEEPLCCRCGRPLSEERAEYCRQCAEAGVLFERGFAPFAYDGEVQDAMMRFKYGHRAEYAAFFAKAIWTFGISFLEIWKPQALVPVPIHRKRQISRGYNQAECIAAELSALSGIPVRTDLIARVKGTMPQKELGRLARRENLRGAFRVPEGAVPPADILVVDDIFTTGSTIDAVSGHLLRAGAKRVWFACASVAAES